MTNLSRLVLSLGVLAFASGCGSKPTPTELVDFPNFSVIFRNSAADGVFIHVFGPDETNELSNRLSANATRPYLVENHDCAGTCSITITSGRNFGTPGQVRVTTTCHWRDRTPPSNAEVVWNGASLTCVGWM